tara:strand:- start:1833 stop:2705 length:873 start_codon:yes stop_codon:yes gene_type:complete
MHKKIDKIINLILEYFVRINFNRKKNIFKNIHKNEFAYFFNDTISKEINLDGIYEKEEISIISKIINKKSNVVDIGANIGNHSLAFSKIAKRVYSFEAHPKTFQILKFNCMNDQKVKLFNIGVSNKKGNLFFKNTKSYNVGGRNLNYSGSIKSHINKLDNLINPKEKIDLIKIDIEGHEYQALRGMSKILSNNKSFLVIEFCENSISIRRKIINFLISQGYLNAYLFVNNKNIFKKNYLNLLVNILKIIFYNSSVLETKLININSIDLIRNKVKGNIIFSKKNINVRRFK